MVDIILGFAGFIAVWTTPSIRFELCGGKLYFKSVSAMFAMQERQWLAEKISFNVHDT